MVYHVQFPGLGLDLTVNRVALAIGGFNIYWYGVIIAAGMLLAMLYAFRNAVDYGIDSDRLVDVVAIGTVMAIVCARIYYVAMAPFEYQNLWEMIDIRLGGIAIYGAVIGAFVFGGLAAKWRKVPLLPLFDLEKLSIEGIYTHFAVADSPEAEDMAYTQGQEDFIVAVYDKLAEMGHTLKHLHFMNSAASVTRPNPRATLARIGIIMYGLEPNYPVHVPMELRPVMSLRSVVSHVKTVEPGACISYGRTYHAPAQRVIATVTIGYADGYARLLSNRASALVHGIACPIVGRVCMDQLMLDVTDVPEKVVPGDVVTMFGRDGKAQITADELAALYGTIGYEIVCGISKRVPRNVIEA